MADWDMGRLEKSLNKAFDTHEASALLHVPQLAQEMMDNPKKAIDNISKTYNKALDDAYTDEKGWNMRGYIEALAGGPFEGIPWAVYNAVGAAYSYYSREQKDKALNSIIRIFDGRNYGEVNGALGAGHTTGIREPLLLADIKIVRPLYWPGLDEGKEILKKFDSFTDLQVALMDNEGMFKHNPTAFRGEEINGVNSDFVMADALLRKDFCNFGEDYLSVANPIFLERVIKGISAMRFGYYVYEENEKRGINETEVEEGRKRLFELFPKQIHDKFDFYRIEKDWVDFRKF